LRPDDVWAISCIVRARGRADEPIDIGLARRMIELRPTGIQSHFIAVQAALVKGDTASASEFARLGGALDVSLTPDNANEVAMLRMFSAATAWLDGRPREAQDTVNHALASVADQPHEIQKYFRWYAAYANLTLGRLRDAERLFGQLDSLEARRGQIWVNMQRRDPARLRDVLVRGRVDATGRAPVSSPSELLEAGMIESARKMVATIDPRVTQYPRVLGELAVVDGNPDRAIEMLEEVHPRERLANSRMRIARFLARAWVQKRDYAQAIRVLEAASKEPRSRLLTAAMMGFAWISVRDQLAETYRAAGRIDEAAAIDAELARLLEVADEDHPIRRRLAARR
jgi:tetratricopeptide (TPR) repeat protein